MTQTNLARVLNVLSVVVLGAIIAILTSRLWSSQGVSEVSLSSQAESATGSTETTSPERVLKLLLATDCKFCDASSEFYRALLAARVSNEFRAVAVFQEPKTLAQEYLRVHSLLPDSVEQSSLSTLGVYGTPTITIEDGNGVQIGRWEGLLTPEKQEEVARKLNVSAVFPAALHAETVSFPASHASHS